jgi:hypothetical protein
MAVQKEEKYKLNKKLSIIFKMAINSAHEIYYWS